MDCHPHRNDDLCALRKKLCHGKFVFFFARRGHSHPVCAVTKVLVKLFFSWINKKFKSFFYRTRDKELHTLYIYIALLLNNADVTIYMYTIYNGRSADDALHTHAHTSYFHLIVRNTTKRVRIFFP